MKNNSRPKSNITRNLHYKVFLLIGVSLLSVGILLLVFRLEYFSNVQNDQRKIMNENTESQILVSYFIEGVMSPPHGKRVWSDGKVEGYWTTKTVKGADGTFHDEDITPGWYEVTKLSAEQVTQLEAAITESGMSELGAQVSDPGTGASDGQIADWEVALNGNLKKIHFSSWPPVSHSQMQDLVSKISDLTAAAQRTDQK